MRQVGRFTRERGFYLGGGTAVALHLGHRRSVDFDWFTPNALSDPLALANELRRANASFVPRDLQPGTLHGSLDEVSLSFLQYEYPLLKPLIDWPDIPCQVASLDDLACMKLVAIAQRGAKKDFIDVYALGTAHRPLGELLTLYERKYGLPDPTSVIVGLTYFDDAEQDPTPPMLWRVTWRTIRKTIQTWVKELHQQLEAP